MSTTSSTAYHTQAAAYLTTITKLFGGYKQRSFEFLQLAPGQRILDAGCGTGDDAILLAQRLGPASTVHGMDVSPDLIDTARQRAAAANVPATFEVMDLYHPTLPENDYDRVRADRVLQHLERPLDALHALKNLTRPGGWLLVADVDWETLILDHPDPVTTEKILAVQRTVVPTPRAGRALYRLFHQAGLDQVETYAETVCITDPAIACFVWGLDGIANQAAQTGHITPDEAKAWLEAMHQAHRKSEFFSSLTGYITRGQKP